MKQNSTITVCSFAIGENYRKELENLIKSTYKYSPDVNLYVGVGEVGNNIIRAQFQRSSTNFDKFCQEELVDIPVPADLICNWNNIGFIKAYWMLHVMRHMKNEKFGEILLWLDADARVRGDLSILDEELGEADIGMVKFEGDHWLNGTIAMRITHENEMFLERWWKKCRALFRPEHDDWRLNDQTVMKNMMIEGDSPPVKDLGEKWASLPPNLVGDKNNPVPVRPRMEDALIHHWQMSRSVIKGWAWPPEEGKRYKDE